jgi:hypothetical protein
MAMWPRASSATIRGGSVGGTSHLLGRIFPHSEKSLFPIHLCSHDMDWLGKATWVSFFFFHSRESVLRTLRKGLKETWSSSWMRYESGFELPVEFLPVYYWKRPPCAHKRSLGMRSSISSQLDPKPLANNKVWYFSWSSQFSSIRTLYNSVPTFWQWICRSSYLLSYMNLELKKKSFRPELAIFKVTFLRKRQCQNAAANLFPHHWIIPMISHFCSCSSLCLHGFR